MKCFTIHRETTELHNFQAEQFRKAREAKGLSLNQMARAVGTELDRYAALEAGEMVAMPEWIARASRVTGLSAAFFFGPYAVRDPAEPVLSTIAARFARLPARDQASIEHIIDGLLAQRGA